MIRAGVDARSSFPALVIASGDSVPMRLLFRGSLQAVDYEDRKKPVGGRDKRIVVSERRLRECADGMVVQMVAHSAQRVAIEHPSGRAHSSAFVAILKEAAENQGIEVAMVSTTWPRVGERDDGIDVARGGLDWSTHESVTGPWKMGDFKATRDAARVLLADMGHVTPRAPVVVSPVRDIVSHVTLANAAPLPAGSANDTTPENMPRRVLAIDTGTHVGMCVAEPLGGGRFRPVYVRTFDVDAKSGAARKDFIEGLSILVTRYNVCRIVIEMVLSMHGRGSNPAAMAAVASMLAQANWIGGMVEGMALTSEFEIETATASSSHWRRQLLGGSTTANDDAVRERVEASFAGWPIAATVHDCDAAGLLLWDAMATAKAAEVGAAVPKAPSRKRTAKESAAKYLAAGCSCENKRSHVEGCPLRIDRSYARKSSAKRCLVCGQPKKGHVCTVAKTEEPRVQNCSVCGLPRKGHICKKKTSK